MSNPPRLSPGLSAHVSAIVACLVVGCSGGAAPVKKQPVAVVPPPTPPPKPAPVKRLKPVCPVPTTAVGAKLALKKPDPKNAPSPNAKDYWKGIRFGRMQFDEIRLYVKHRYIDARINESRALAEAASFAIGSSRNNTLLLLPQSFYEQRCKHADERGQLLGPVIKIRGLDRFVIVDAKPIKRPRRRMSDDQIRDLRKQLRKRTALLEAAWSRDGFTARNFLQVMSWAKKNLAAEKDWSVQRGWIAAAQGYMFSLDPHSSLIPTRAWAEATKTDPSFEGIGAVLTRKPNNDHTIVETPMEGYPAEASGLKAGDVILKVDGTSTKSMPLPKVVDRIRGKAGTKVVLTVERIGEPKPLDIGIIRAKVVVKNVSSNILPGHPGIGVIKIRGFIKTTHRDVKRALRQLKAAAGTGGLRGLVLDLRSNGGGLLNQGVDVADEFLRSGLIVTVRARIRPRVQHYRARSSATNLPLVVLVNDASASASEIVAAALQENRRALVVGERSFGKATVQTLFTPLNSRDYYIKLTIARYHTPTDRALQAIGVHPDVKLPRELGGKTPLGFREENLSNHLWAGSPYKPSAKDRAYAATVKTCAETTGKAKQLKAKNPNPQIKFDYQRAFASDMLYCMTKHKR